MIPLNIHLDGEGERDLGLDPDKPVVEGALRDIGLKRNGTVGGRAVVFLVVELPDGSQVAAQTSWRLFKYAAGVFAADPIVLEEGE